MSSHGARAAGPTFTTFVGVLVCGPWIGSCGRSTLLADDRPKSLSDAHGVSPEVCPVRASPRLNGVGQALGLPKEHECPGPPEPAREPCPGQCGNGTVDDCVLTAGTLESCDGANLGGADCNALGFAGGSLSCDPFCRFDPTGCTDCARDERVQACRRAEVGSSPLAVFDLAASDDVVAVAGFSRGLGGESDGLRVLLFDSNFRLVKATGCFDFPGPTAVALTTTSAGFILAAANPRELRTYALSREGAVTASTLFAGVGAPVLATNPTSGALLLYSDGESWSAALLDASASPLWSTPIFGPGLAPGTAIAAEGNGVNAVYADDGFLLSGGGSYIERIEMDGRVACLHRLADFAASTKIAWSVSQGSAIWGLGYNTPGFTTPALYSAKLDRDGARVTDPIRFATSEGPPVSVAPFDDGTSLVTSNGPWLEPPASKAYLPLGAYRIDATWVDAAGNVSRGPTPLAANGYGSEPPRMSRRGADVVVAWLGQAALPRDEGPAWLTLARVSR